MVFTPEQLSKLEKPFAPGDHAFVRGNVYLKKQAIRRRLSEIDPGWTNTPAAKLEVSDTLIVLQGGLTVLGVTRFGIGTGIIQTTKKGDDGKPTELSAYDIALNTAKAYKTAASDLLPRCALEFGIGWYLKDMPKDDRGKSTVTNMMQLTEWLKSLSAPKHWAADKAARERVIAKLNEVNILLEYALAKVEPGKPLEKLSDTTLTEDQFLKRLDDLKNAPVLADAPH